MRLCIILLLFFFVSGCASTRGPAGEYNFETSTSAPAKFEGVYGRLNGKSHSSVKITDLCLSGPNYKEKVPGISCDYRYFKNSHNGYFNLQNKLPVFRTDGYICLTYWFFKHQKIKNRKDYNGVNISKCKPGYYWESDLILGEFAQYLFIIPVFMLPTYNTVYFDRKDYSKAISHALRNSDMHKIELEIKKLKNEYKSRAIEIENKKSIRHAEIEAKKKERSDEIRKEKALANQASSLFEKISKQPKELGAKICNKNNTFGFVENIANSKIQVRLIGKVLYKPDHYFFYSHGGEFEYKYEVSNKIVWENSQQWAACGFGDITD